MSRASSPKFLHSFTDGSRSLLQATLARLAPIAPVARTLVVTGASHAVAVARQLPQLPEANVLIEPSSRDSAPAIGLAAALIGRRNPDAIMGSFAADHHIADPDRLVVAVREAIAVAERGYLVTVGLTPTRPETGYGYLKLGKELPGAAGFAVDEFAEKPSPDRARQYFESGNYLWNASMFVWRVSAMLAELQRQQPELYEGLMAIAADWDSPRREKTLAKVWPMLPKIAVDYAIMEGAAARGLVATIPADVGWHDVGDWHAVGEILQGDENDNAVLGDVSLCSVKSRGCVVAGSSGRSVSIVGLDGVVVVDTPDALLVCSRESSQDVKQIVGMLGIDDPLR
jgi:mannose-1-phosphate guanylyltransferase